MLLHNFWERRRREEDLPDNSVNFSPLQISQPKGRMNQGPISLH